MSGNDGVTTGKPLGPVAPSLHAIPDDAIANDNDRNSGRNRLLPAPQRWQGTCPGSWPEIAGGGVERRSHARRFSQTRDEIVVPVSTGIRATNAKHHTADDV